MNMRSLYQEEERLLIARDEEFRAEEAVKTSLVASPLMSHPKPRPSVSSVLHTFIVSLSKGTKVTCFGYFFEFHISISTHSFEIKCFFPVNLFYVNLTIRPTKEPRREEGKTSPFGSNTCLMGFLYVIERRVFIMKLVL